MIKKCIWCLQTEITTTFINKAHSIPQSLGGQNYNKHVCDICNSYFGSTNNLGFSIESALKETFCISRYRFLYGKETKRKVGRFKSKFFDIKERNNKLRVVIKPTFLFKNKFQEELYRSFKRGLIKMWFEEYDRQTNHLLCLDNRFNNIREFSRYNKNDLPIVYFERTLGILLFKKDEATTPTLILNRMNYLINNESFVEIEFLGHVFGFPIQECTKAQFDDYIYKSLDQKKKLFKSAKLIEKVTDVDLTLSIMDKV